MFFKIPDSPPASLSQRPNIKQRKKRQLSRSVIMEVTPPDSPTESESEINTPPASKTPSSSSQSDSHLFCLEEVSFQDDSDEDEIYQEKDSVPESQTRSVKCRSAKAPSTPATGAAQLRNSVPPMSILYSPKSPWLTSSSPQITSVFSTTLSPPMQCQNTPHFHLSPPISSPMVPCLYDGPCITIPNSPGLLSMNSYDEDRGEIYWMSGEYNIQH